MTSDFLLVTIGECCDITTGYPFKSACYTDKPGGIRLVRGDNIVQGYLRWDGVKRWDPENLDKALEAKYSLKEDDVVLAMDRPWIEAGLKYSSIGRYDLPSLLVQRVARLRANNGVDQRLLKYIIGSKEFTNHILSIQTGTAVPHISSKQIAEYSFSLPPRSDQKAIAHILGTLDDKIELNRKTNETLEGIAKALFKSWFVDFDPVRAKVEERPTGLPDEISELFPDSFEESELGEIPSEWKASTLGDENEIVMGQSPPGHTYNEEGIGLPFYQGRSDFGFRHPGERVYCSEPSRLAEAGSTLMSVRAPVGSINMANKTCCVGRGVASIRSAQGNHAYTYYLMDSIQDLFDSYNSEGTVFGAINKKDLSAIQVVQPSAGPERIFEQFASQVDRRISLSLDESASLTALRDALLPRLISGELRVPDAEKMLEEVGI